jgi:hypothetical protein
VYTQENCHGEKLSRSTFAQRPEETMPMKFATTIRPLLVAASAVGLLAATPAEPFTFLEAKPQ